MRTRGWWSVPALVAVAAALSGCAEESAADPSAPSPTGPGVEIEPVAVAGATTPFERTAPGDIVGDVDPALVADCIEFVKVQAFVGDPVGVDLWNLAGGTDNGLEVQCRVMAETDPDRVRAMQDELARLEEAAAEEAAATTLAPGCHSGYGDCLPIVSDVDCEGSGDGPVWIALSVVVYGDDEYEIDGDADGLACEPGDR